MLANAAGELFDGEEPHPTGEAFSPAVDAAGVVHARPARALNARHLVRHRCDFMGHAAASAVIASRKDGSPRNHSPRCLRSLKRRCHRVSIAGASFIESTGINPKPVIGSGLAILNAFKRRGMKLVCPILINPAHSMKYTPWYSDSGGGSRSCKRACKE